MTRPVKKQLYPLYAIGMVLLVLVAAIYLVSALPIDALSEINYQGLSPLAIPAITLLHLLYLSLAAATWRRLVFVVTGTNSSFPDAYLQMVSLAVGKYVPGKVWGVVARTGQLSRVGVSPQMSIVTSVIEQLVVLFAGGVVAIGAAFLTFPDYWPGIAMTGVALVVGLTILSGRVPEIVEWLQRRRGNTDNVLPIVRSKLEHWLQFILLHAVIWLVSGVTLCFIYFSLFDAEVTTQGIAALILANTIGFIVGFLALFAPGGIGVREATTVAVLAPFFPIGEALIAVIVLRAWMVLFDGVNCGLMLIAEIRHVAARSE